MYSVVNFHIMASLLKVDNSFSDEILQSIKNTFEKGRKV